MVIPLVRKKVVTILGWRTDSISVDFPKPNKPTSALSVDPHVDVPHTVIVFVPGNPGCVDWYIPTLVKLVTKLGRGYAARGASYAGHGVTQDIVDVESSFNSINCDARIPWTINGQTEHKIAFVDMILADVETMTENNKIPGSTMTSLIFLSHSIGAHMTQRLCIRRKDILQRTKMLLHLMPYTRMDAPLLRQWTLNLGASSPETLIWIGQNIMELLKRMPPRWVNDLMESDFHDTEGRELAVKLLREPRFARNFFELGTEEIRDVPEETDVSPSSREFQLTVLNLLIQLCLGMWAATVDKVL